MFTALVVAKCLVVSASKTLGAWADMISVLLLTLYNCTSCKEGVKATAIE
jgi:hypothetical protein